MNADDEFLERWGDLPIDADDEGDTDVAFGIVRVKQYRAPRVVKFARALDAARAVGLLEVGEHVDMIVSWDFIAGDFIEAYLKSCKLIATEIIISTLSLNRDNVDSLGNILDCYLDGRMGLIISDYFFANERHAWVKDIIQRLGSDNRFFLAAAGVHTKITLIKTACGQNIVIGGSANLRSSMNIEQITIDNSEIIYNFHREWMSKILNEYHVSHKMLRREKLWQLVAKAEEQKKSEANSEHRD